MYLYLELWKPRPAWQQLPADKRQAFIEGIGPAIGGLTEAGIELLGFAFNDTDTPHRADYAYIAAWSMPNKALAEQLEQVVGDYGFHDYFEQVNARGEVTGPENVLADMFKA